MTEGSSGVTRVRAGPAVDESGTSLRLEPNFRITLVIPDGTVATCTEYVRPRCESSTIRVIQTGFKRGIRRKWHSRFIGHGESKTFDGGLLLVIQRFSMTGWGG